MALALFLSATQADADYTACSTGQISANPGDTVRGFWTLDRVRHDVGRVPIAQLYSNSGQFQWDPGSQTCGTCGWSVVPTDYDPTIWAVSLNGADISCHFSGISVHPNPAYLPVLQVTKKRAQPWMYFWTTASAVSYRISGKLSGTKGYPFILLGYYGSKQAQHYNKVINDPAVDCPGVCDQAAQYQDDPGTINDTGWVCYYVGDDFSDGALPNLCGKLYQALYVIVGLENAITDSLDRASSCDQVGLGCGNQRRSEANDFFHQAGAWQAWFQNLTQQLNGELENNGVDVVDDDSGWSAQGLLIDMQGPLGEGADTYQNN